ncbi:MAG: hypothetical protein II868_09330, partial [Butyrivibrio sp.]|nr:hypothetical protein [Butyrivibrio sp.]
IRLADLIQEYAEKHGDEKILFGMSASGIADSLKETAEKAAPTAAVTLTDRRGTLSSLSVDLTFTASPALAPSDFRFLSAKDETGDRFVLKIDVTFDEGQGTRDPADSRSCVADFRIENARTLGEIQALADAGSVEEAVLPGDRVFRDLDKIVFAGEARKAAVNGNALRLNQLISFAPDREQDPMEAEALYKNEERVRLYDENGVFFGVYRYDAKKRVFQTEKFLYRADA